MSEEALHRFALDLREAADRFLASLAPAGARDNEHSVTRLSAELMRLVPGSTQRAVLGLADLYSSKGLTTEEVRAELDLAEPAQAFQPLQRLQSRHLVEQVPDVRPKRWRIAGEHRRRLSPRAGQP